MNNGQINKHLNEINEILDKLHQINNYHSVRHSSDDKSTHVTRKVSPTDFSVRRDFAEISSVSVPHKYELSVNKEELYRQHEHVPENTRSAALDVKESEHQKDFMSNPTITLNDVSEKHKYISHNHHKSNHNESNINEHHDDAKYVELSLMDLDEEYSSALRKIMKR